MNVSQEIITIAKGIKGNTDADVVVCNSINSMYPGNKKITGFFFMPGLHVGYKGNHSNGDPFEVIAIV